MTSQTTARAIVLTVGTGNVEAPRKTLLEPLTKSIRQGDWTRVVLLPSQITTETAAQLREELEPLPIEVRPLPAPGLEDNPDACFEHFDTVIAELRAAGFAEILADFTRGTKAMSAALVLAAVRHDLARLRYISGKRDQRGMVLPGEETVCDIPVAVVSASRHLDQARHFFRQGNFAAALEILPDTNEAAWPEASFNVARQVRLLAEFYSAWDRFDYRAAALVTAVDASILPREWTPYAARPAMREWVASLTVAFPESYADRAAYLRHLVVDLWANGCRRVRQRQYEDAILRAYRVLELLGQIRLFDHGLDSASLPPDHPAVAELQEKLEKKKSAALSRGPNGTLLASREQVARLLKVLGDPLATDLMDLGSSGAVKPSARNLSVLIHGFQAAPVDTPQPLDDLYGRLEKLIQKDGHADVEASLRTARSLDFSARQTDWAPA